MSDVRPANPPRVANAHPRPAPAAPATARHGATSPPDPADESIAPRFPSGTSPPTPMGGSANVPGGAAALFAPGKTSPPLDVLPTFPAHRGDGEVAQLASGNGGSLLTIILEAAVRAVEQSRRECCVLTNHERALIARLYGALNNETSTVAAHVASGGPVAAAVSSEGRSPHHDRDADDGRASHMSFATTDLPMGASVAYRGDLPASAGWEVTRNDARRIKDSWKVVSGDFDTLVAGLRDAMTAPSQPALLRDTMNGVTLDRHAEMIKTLLYLLTSSLDSPVSLQQHIRSLTVQHCDWGIADYDNAYKPFADAVCAVIPRMGSTEAKRKLVETSWRRLLRFVLVTVRDALDSPEAAQAMHRAKLRAERRVAEGHDSESASPDESVDTVRSSHHARPVSRGPPPRAAKAEPLFAKSIASAEAFDLDKLAAELMSEPRAAGSREPSLDRDGSPTKKHVRVVAASEPPTEAKKAAEISTAEPMGSPLAASPATFVGTSGGSVLKEEPQYQAFVNEMERLPSFSHFLDAATHRDFDIWEVVDACKALEEKTGGQTPWAYIACAKIILHLLSVSGLPRKFNVPIDTLRRLVFLVMRKYHASVTYHNFYHATDVFQTTFAFLYEGHCDQLFTPLQQYTLLLACLFHDMGHLGLNNAFHLKTESTVGIVTASVHSGSVMELRHCGLMSTLLEALPGVFGTTSPQEQKWIRKALVRVIMATDMSRHIELTKQFDSMFTDPASYLGNKPPSEWPAPEEGHPDPHETQGAGITAGANVADEHVLVALDMVLKLADVSNVAKPHKVARRWGSLVTEEFYTQGDEERRLGLEPIPTFDRRKADGPTALANSQIGFINFMVKPMYVSCQKKLFPGLEWWLQCMFANIDLYVEEKESGGKIVGGVPVAKSE